MEMASDLQSLVSTVATPHTAGGIWRRLAASGVGRRDARLAFLAFRTLPGPPAFTGFVRVSSVAMSRAAVALATVCRPNGLKKKTLAKRTVQLLHAR